MDEKELLGVKFFLKQLANEYNDMDLVSRGILDKDKAAQAKELAKQFRVEIRECDDALSSGNVQKIIDKYPTSSKKMSDFLALLQDVPDEL